MLALSLPSGTRVCLADTGRLSLVRGEVRTPIATGVQLYDLIVARAAYRTDLQQLRDFIEIELSRRIPKQTRAHLQTSRKVVCAAIAAMQGDIGKWACEVVASLFVTHRTAGTPALVSAMAAADSPMHQALISLYRYGHSAAAAAAELARLSKRSDGMREVA